MAKTKKAKKGTKQRSSSPAEVAKVKSSVKCAEKKSKNKENVNEDKPHCHSKLILFNPVELH